MQVELEVLEAQVLSLSSEDRARLLDRLILSLDEDKVRDAAWNELAAQRDEEIESGLVAEIDGDFISKYGPPQIPVLGVETDGIAMNEVLKVGFVGEALQAMVVHPMHIRANPGFAPPRWARTG